MDYERKYFFDDPNNIKRLLYVLYGICILLLLLDFVIHRHVSHQWENLWGFYPIYGFVGCVVLVLVAKWMRTFLMRSEDYYDDDSTVDADETSTTDTKTSIHEALNNKTGSSHVDD